MNYLSKEKKNMYGCEITLSANAGVAINLCDICIWIDFLHNNRIKGFSGVTPEIQEAMMTCENFRAPDIIFYTHNHPDHFSRELNNAAIKLFPQASVIMPWKEYDKQILLRNPHEKMSIKGINMEFIMLPHSGKGFEKIVNFGCVIEKHNFRVLILGDSEVGIQQLERFESAKKTDLAILNFPWVTTKLGRDFLKEVLKPKRIVLFHLPFLEDDIFGYNSATKHALNEHFKNWNVQVLREPLQAERIK